MHLKNYKSLAQLIESTDAQLVAVSKTKPAAEIRKVYDQGQRIFGENRAQELATKQPELPEDIEWHMIGSLQRNKVKYIAPFVSMIESVDSLKLLKEIHKQASKHDRVIDVLLQFKIAEEETKSGMNDDEVAKIAGHMESLDHVRICGVMGMASFVSDMDQVRREFQDLKQIFDRLKATHFGGEEFCEISMGMSGDYEVALEEGSTMVRIGSLIFGARK